MFIACFLLWGVLLLVYGPHLAVLFDVVESTVSRCMVAFVISWIGLVWFYGVFHVLSVLFSIFSGSSSPRTPSNRESTPSVAVLYTTRNDFRADAVVSCLSQTYANFTVFILDDSSEPAERVIVDAFCASHPDGCVLVRRPDTSGFKAGNLNYAIKTVASAYDLFAVVDADEMLPRDFLARAVPCFGIDDNIGFVQANHVFVTDPDSSFSSDMTSGADLHWGLFLPARNRFGFVMFYGHGAVIRTDVWRATGGFPEIVSEDIAFAARARERGFRGHFIKDLVAREAFPSDYQRFLRREIKVVRGTLQFLLGHARSFLSCRHITVVEKLDLLLSAVVLYLPIPFLAFLLVANVVLPVAIARHAASVLPPWSVGTVSWLSGLEPLGVGLQRLWTWDFFLVTVLAILSPLAYQIRGFVRSPLRAVVYAARSTAVFLSAVPTVAWATLTFPSRKQPEFLATGGRSRSSAATQRCTSGLPTAIAGIFLCVFALLAQNIAVLTIGLSFALHYVLIRARWDSRFVRVVSLVPFLFFLSVFGSIPFLIVGVAGALSVLVPAHH